MGRLGGLFQSFAHLGMSTVPDYNMACQIGSSKQQVLFQPYTALGAQSAHLACVMLC